MLWIKRNSHLKLRTNSSIFFANTKAYSAKVTQPMQCKATLLEHLTDSDFKRDFTLVRNLMKALKAWESAEETKCSKVD